MNSIAKTPPPPAPRHAAARWIAHAVSLACGIGTTALILWSLGHVSEAAPEKAELPMEDIRAVDLPELPPPSPDLDVGVPLPPAPVVFEEAPIASDVHLAPTPVAAMLLQPPAPLTAEIRFSYSPGEFKPGASGWDADVRHIFQKAEVDQTVYVVYRRTPDIPASLLRQVKKPEVTLLFVVNIDGSVENVQVEQGTEPEFDQLVVEAIRQWKFRPAIRKGRKVRQMAELQIIVVPPRSNPFSTN